VDQRESTTIVVTLVTRSSLGSSSLSFFSPSIIPEILGLKVSHHREVTMQKKEKREKMVVLKQDMGGPQSTINHFLEIQMFPFNVGCDRKLFQEN
jgi:hypothetical protein